MFPEETSGEEKNMIHTVFQQENGSVIPARGQRPARCFPMYFTGIC